MRQVVLKLSGGVKVKDPVVGVEAAIVTGYVAPQSVDSEILTLVEEFKLVAYAMVYAMPAPRVTAALGAVTVM